MFILALIIVASFILTGGFTVYQSSTTSQDSTSQTVELVQGSPQPAYQTLQLQTLTFTTSNPVPAAAVIPAAVSASKTAVAPPAAAPAGPPGCADDTGQPMPAGCTCFSYVYTCANHKCTSISEPCLSQTVVPPEGCPPPNFSADCGGGARDICPTTADGNGSYCIGKPVIYLYPVKDTVVNVSINIPGSIVESIPTYVNGGWTVLTHPNGSLEYLDKIYTELYYESSVTKVNPPKQGFVVTKSQAEAKLIEITTKLGLIKPEQDEFLSYWLPQINKLSVPYLFISVIDQKEKDRIDNVVISPKPDTKIEFLVYFKPVYAPFSPQELNLPDQSPKRNGFTSVEWGGTIDTN